MIDISKVEWEGLDGLGEELMREIRPRMEVALMKGGLMLEGAIKRKLTGGGRTGRIYKVSKTGELHVASAPGEPPAKLLGHLGGSVGHSDPVWGPVWEVSMDVGPGLGAKPKDGSADPGDAYARRMEFGGADNRGIMILPRPYMEPSVREEEPKIQAVWERMLGS